MSDELSKGDAIFDQLHADIREGAICDIKGWAEFGRKIDLAAYSREDCGRIQFTREERYKLVRLAHLAHHLVTGRLLNREI